MTQNGAVSKPIGIQIFCLKALLPIVKKQILEKQMRFLTLDLQTKQRTSERTFQWILCEMIVEKELKLKAEIDLSLSLI